MRRRLNSWSYKRFLYANHTEEQGLTIYIYSNGEIPYIDLMSSNKVIVLPHSVQRKVIGSS